MTEPRLKSKIRIDAHLTRVRAAGAFAAIARVGDADAGVIAVKVYMGAGRAKLFIQSRDLDGNPIWREPVSKTDSEQDVDAWLQKEISIDPDLWVLEIEDKDGRAFLE